MKTGDQVVQELPWRWGVHGKIFFICGLGYMFDAWDVMLNGYLIPLIGADWALPPAALGWVGTANLLGMAVGAVLWGSIADVIGRKKAFIWTLLMFAIFSGLGALSPNFIVFCLLRFIAGIGLGGCIPVDATLIGEFMPAKKRGVLLTLTSIWYPIGATMAGISATLLLPLDSWRILLGIMVVPALLVVWIRSGVPESPLYLVRRGRKEEANAVISDLARRVGVALPEWTMPTPAPTERLTPAAIGRQLVRLWKHSAKTTSAIWALFFTVLVIFYAALIWMPNILVDEGFSREVAFMVTTMMTAVGIPAMILSAWLVHVIGRKWVLGVSGVLAALALVIFTTQLDAPTSAKLWVAAYGFLIEVSIPALYTMAVEVYPTHIRTSGFGWASTVSRVGAGFTPVILGALLWPWLGLTGSFIVLGAFLLVAVLWMIVAVPETKGRELDHLHNGADRAEQPAASASPGTVS